MCLVCQLSFAKDVIVTKQSEKIDAKIVEVSDEEVRYKKIGNLNGPTFVIKTKEISTVVYENGDIQTFKEYLETSDYQNKVSDNESAMIQSSVIQKNEDEMKNSSKQVSNLPKIVYTKITLPNGKKRKRYHSEDNSLIMKSSEFESYLAAHCPVAHRQLRKSHGTAAASILLDFICLPVGIVLCIVSTSQSSKVLPMYNESCAGN